MLERRMYQTDYGDWREINSIVCDGCGAKMRVNLWSDNGIGLSCALPAGWEDRIGLDYVLRSYCPACQVEEVSA